MPTSIRLRSYAKINWTLDVLFRREDGYHELRTIYQTISLHDRLSITATAGGVEVICDDPRAPSDETNLAYKAATLLREATGTRQGVRIEIEKRISVAAGLGGGSSNAASVLLGLGRVWGSKIDESKLIEIASSLGSDVPFFLIGGTALGIGRGEEVYPLEEVRCDNLLLANPGLAVSTEGVYARLPRLTRSQPVRIIPFTLLAAKAVCELPLRAGNDLEEVVLAAHPEIAELKRRLISLKASHTLMSGSGATVVGIFDNLQTSARARDELRAEGFWSECARTISRQEYSKAIFE